MTLPKVAVLGAGPSGLAAAKALLEHGLQPVVFESSRRLGGMWEGPGRGAWSEFARTNISYHSCCFSDLAWPAGTDVFPLRHELLGYLQRYAKTFDLPRHIRFATCVDTVGPNGDGRWHVGWRDANGPGTDLFDHVIIGTGGSTKPFRPDFPGLSSFAGEVFHSAMIDHASLVHIGLAGKRVLVVGAAFSGTEIAAELAPHAQVTVTLRHPMWFLPRWVRATNGGPYYPLDLVIYNRRADNPLVRDPHVFLRRAGGDPGAASPELAFDRGPELPMTVVVADDFLERVRAGLIAVKRSATLRFDATGVSYADGTHQPFDAVIFCTGFTTTLPFLDAATLETLGFDPHDQLISKTLHRDMFHPDLPGLTFIGHYRGPYFPIMELQARWIARVLAGELAMPDRATMLAGVAAAAALRARRPRPQFPHGDFVGLADGLAREVGVFPTLAESDPLRLRVLEGPLIAAQYRLVGPHAKPDQARAQITATPAPICDDPPPADPPPLGRRVLDLLCGYWALERQIEPGGRFSGTASFTHRAAESLLYREDGELVTDAGMVLTGEASYVYALRNDDIEVSFADGVSRGVHFIDITLPHDQPEVLPVVSVDRHLCRLDTYDASFQMATADRFTVTYVVRGPTKNYVSRTQYRRLDGSGGGRGLAVDARAIPPP
jgi:dimethylaniline monooxygenase (N-oxide forming)